MQYTVHTMQYAIHQFSIPSKCQERHSQKFHHLCMTRSLSTRKSSPTSTGRFRQFHNSGNTQNSYNSLSKNTSFIFYKFLYVAIDTLFSKSESSLEYPFNEMGKCVETSKSFIGRFVYSALFSSVMLLTVLRQNQSFKDTIKCQTHQHHSMLKIK